MYQNGYKQQLNLPNSQNHQLTPLSNLSTQPYQPDTPGPPQILPPLYMQQHQQAHNQYQSVPQRAYTSGTNTPHTPHTPLTPISGGPANGMQNGSLPSLMAGQPPTQFAPIIPNYTGPQSLPSIGSSAPASNQSNGSSNGYPPTSLPNLSPSMFNANNRQTQPISSYSSQPQLLSQPHSMPNAEPRLLPVVGSQGRRGILPSAPGRTAAASGVQDAAGRQLPAPQKNAEGKYPCQFCNKTYLHAKHLKRHNLRHTGERPYQCSLCSETFCRSDILKRHFVKCAVRRGNPTNATHLTHAQAHLKQSQSGPTSSPSGPPSAPNAPNTESGAALNGVWRNNLGNELNNASNRSSRSSSIMRPGSSGSEDKRRYSTTNTVVQSNVRLEPGSTNPLATQAAPSHSDRSYTNYALPPDRLTSQSYNNSQQQHAYSAAPPTSSYPIASQQDNPPSLLYPSNGFNNYNTSHQPHVNGENWSTYFQPGAHDALMFSSQ